MKLNFKITLLLLVVSQGLSGCSLLGKLDGNSIWRGVYVSGFEVSAFVPCNSQGKDYWLDLNDNSGKVQQLEQTINNIRFSKNKPYPAVYVELSGKDIGKADEGFAEDYDAVLSADKLLDFNTNIPKTCHWEDRS